jgi:type III pantothenate kinase
MMLLLDIGNTCMKWAFLREQRLEQTGMVLRGDKEFKDLAKASWTDGEVPDQVLVCNVAGSAIKKSVTLWIKRHWKQTPVFVQADAESCGVRNAYHEPKKLGADRWAALIGARHLVAGPVCVIDCGTAITIDALAEDGRHLGGLIIPGLGLMARSLIERAPDIHEPSPNTPGEVALFARDTDNAVTGGALYAAVSLLDRAVADVAAELGPRLAVIITGGDGERIAKLLRCQVLVEPQLVLMGLARLAQSPEA